MVRKQITLAVDFKDDADLDLFARTLKHYLDEQAVANALAYTEAHVFLPTDWSAFAREMLTSPPPADEVIEAMLTSPCSCCRRRGRLEQERKHG